MAKNNSITTFKTALGDLKTLNKPIYYFCGEENFFLSRLQDAAETLIPEEQTDFNFDLIYARDKSPDQVLGIVRSFPMMAEKRMVIVRDFLSLNISSYNSTGRGGGLDDFLPYFEQPNPSTALILFDEKAPSGRTRLGKAIKKNKKVGYYSFDAVKDYLLADWIIDWTEQHHQRKMAPQAAQLLAQQVGNSLQVLSTEIDKVCTFVDTSERISLDDIKKVTGSYRDYSVFELKDAVFSRNIDESMHIVEQMLQHSKSNTGVIIGTVGFFYSVFTNIWQILRLSAKGQSKRDVQSALGISSGYYFNNLWSDATAFELHEMSRIFEALLDADSAAKGFSKLDPSTILLLMIKRIIN